ncbi:hypothetical protein ACS0TY_027686 [Phlomoides rotata]
MQARSTYIPRRELWSSICAHVDRPLCVMGDFNVVLGAHEWSRGAQNPTRPSQEFMAFLDEAHLHDMDTAGPQFSWVTRRSNHGYMAARLDRVLANDDFLDFWHSVAATVLPRISSDHHPIILSPIQLVTQKLKHLKATLKNWNRVVFKNIYMEMEEASEALNAIQAEAALHGDTEDRLLTEIDCTVHLNTVLH